MRRKRETETGQETETIRGREGDTETRTLLIVTIREFTLASKRGFASIPTGLGVCTDGQFGI